MKAERPTQLENLHSTYGWMVMKEEYQAEKSPYIMKEL